LDSEWRLDFHDAEIQIIKDKGCAKPVIKLLKLFRNTNIVMKNLSSYLLKSIVMDLIRTNPSDDWSQDEWSKYFLLALKKLLDKLEMENVDYFFDNRSNILWKMKSAEMNGISGWLKRVLPKLELSQNTDNCRTVWRPYFTSNN
jgi:hypothetical protein